ncbi:MAG TPA: NAD(P)-binding domain-containing protein [Stellaceae bacterium]|nr:NAD(P)-binding domain-containing protein [Stellaceae bacterium]
MKVGFIGLGMMGKDMAANLKKAGHLLVVYTLSLAAAEPYLANGATSPRSTRCVAPTRIASSLAGDRRVNNELRHREA